MLSMKKLSRIALIMVLTVALFNQTSPLYAGGPGPGPRDRAPQDHGPRGRDYYYTPHYMPQGREMRTLPRDYFRIIIGGLEYFYWEGMFYRMNANRYVVVPAPIGAVVTTIPQGSQPVIVDGVPYYNINGVTYMYTPTGYQVVPQPKTIIIKNYTAETSAAAPAQIQNTTNTQTASPQNNEESFTVNVPNAKGSYTAVTLKRSGNGFIGPQGEFYTEFPRIEQLKVMYGK